MTARTRETDGEVLAATRAMYDAYGDRPRFDAHLHPDVTIWESDQPGGLIGLPELDALRDSRSAAADAPRPVLSVLHAVVDRWGDGVAVIRYVLRAELAGAVTEFRVTDVLAGSAADGPDGGGSPVGWRIVHHHAEHLTTAPDRPADGSTDVSMDAAASGGPVPEVEG
jgi:hypothetical protein